MEPADVALSDVHVGRPHEKTAACIKGKDYQVVRSRFLYRCPVIKDDEDEVSDPSGDEASHFPDIDDDGDLIMERKPDSCYNEVITLEHAMSTRLPDVGLQVWLACLLLSEYILHRPDLVKDCIVLELGGGLGLASLVAGIHARLVICTDLGKEILALCERNIQANHEVLGGNTDKVLVRELDWFDDDLPSHSPTTGHGKADSPFSWSFEDRKLLDQVDVIIAADVVYEDDLTDAFFLTVHRLMCARHTRTVLISLERRLNFTLDALDVACPAHAHFRACLEQLGSLHPREGYKYQVHSVETDFPQCFQYQRTKYLELWQIRAVPGE